MQDRDSGLGHCKQTVENSSIDFLREKRYYKNNIFGQRWNEKCDMDCGSSGGASIEQAGIFLTKAGFRHTNLVLSVENKVEHEKVDIIIVPTDDKNKQ